MKQEFLKSLGLSDEIIGQIQAESGKDVTAEKLKTQVAEEKIQVLTEQVNDYVGQISQLKQTGGDVKTLQKKINELQGLIDTRAENDRKDAEKKALQERFDAVCGTHKFVNELTRKGVFEEFCSGLKDEKNKGKGDADIYTALTKDRADIFANENPAADIPGAAQNIDRNKPSATGFFDVIKENQTIKR